MLFEIEEEYENPFTEDLTLIKQRAVALREKSEKNINRGDLLELRWLMNVKSVEIELLEFAEMTFLPDYEKRLFLPLRGLDIDMTGLPYSGKSSIADNFVTRHPDFRFLDEHHHQFIADPKVRTTLRRMEEFPLFFRNYSLALLKMTNSGINFETDFLKDLFITDEEWDPYEDRITMRGINDLFSVCRYLDKVFTKSIESGSAIEDFGYGEEMMEALGIYESLDIHKIFISFIERSFHYLHQYDLVALFYIDFETAVQRRIDAGLEPYGRVVNPIYWPAVENSYKWWLHYMYPFLREHYGTGLIVIDGSKSRRRNNDRFTEYMNAVKIEHDTLRSMSELWRPQSTITNHISSKKNEKDTIR